MEPNVTTVAAMVLNWIIMVLLLTGIVVFIVWIVKRTGSSGPGKNVLDIARERYAKGEILKEEFEQIRKDLS